MNLLTLAQKYNTQAKCVKYLEKVRWNGKPKCPYCEESTVSRRMKIPFRIQKYHCNKCNRDFTVLSGTIFEASKLPLPKWFQLIHLMLTAPKGISSMQLSRTLGITYKTAWYCSMRVRCAMIDDEIDLLEGIVEQDESYLGGRPRRRNRPGQTSENAAILNQMEDSPKKIKRGRGTKKVPVVGIVEREGKKRVRLEVMEKLTGKNLLAMLKRYVNTEKAIAVTDEYPAYAKFEEELQHLVVKHKEHFFADGELHTNTIENVWSIIKNGLRGQYHALSKKYLPFYLAEWAYKYNRRNERPSMFAETIEHAVTEEKPMLDYKPTKPVAEITTGDAIRKAAEREATAKRAERALRGRKPKLRATAYTKNKSKRIKKKATVSRKPAKRIVRRKTTNKNAAKNKLAKEYGKISKKHR
ncbi:MAG: hypothetical protein FD123_950 [Bacteroidetes bacterium]|nr:MAG: hypothetical protein FD123_950 [Bacteroidota bacterium]